MSQKKNLRTTDCHRDSRAGFSFVEILIFVTIISFLFIALTATVATAVRQSKAAEYRIHATHYADILEEWFRAEKDLDWETFVARDISQSGTLYCFNNQVDFAATASAWPDPGVECTDVDGVIEGIAGYDGIYRNVEGVYEQADIAIPRIFKRYAVLTRGNPEGTQMNVQIIVEWFDGNRFYAVPQNTIFTITDEG